MFVFGDTSDLLDDDVMDWTVGNPVLLPIPSHECDFVVSCITADVADDSMARGPIDMHAIASVIVER